MNEQEELPFDTCGCSGNRWTPSVEENQQSESLVFEQISLPGMEGF